MPDTESTEGKAMLIKAIKQYKFWTLGSLAMVILVVGTTLWQPQILTKVLEAVSNNDKEKIMDYGIQLIIIAGLACSRASSTRFLQLRLPKACQLICGSRLSVKSKVSLMPISRNLMPATSLSVWPMTLTKSWTWLWFCFKSCVVSHFYLLVHLF